MRTRASRSVICILLITASARAQTVLYVDDDGGSKNGCTSWADACPELQTALSLAGPGDQIWVAVGIYRPDYDIKTGQHTGNREASFQLISGVAIYGGFDGTETTLEDRASLFDQTILSSDLDGDDMPDDFPSGTSFAENSFHVTVGSGKDASAILDGFTITAGNAVGPLSDGYGGGMLNSGGHPTVSNCRFIANAAEITGGGIANFVGGSPTITTCTFEGNIAFWGGAISNQESSTTMINCTLTGNLATGLYGGAMNNEVSTVIATNCVFAGNSAACSGGGMKNQLSNLALTNCTFVGNSSMHNGGAMYNVVGVGTVIGCTFSQNVAGQGGGIYNTSGSDLTVSNCMFVGNSATENIGGGGMLNVGSDPTVSNCIFTGNTAYIGAGMRNTDSFLTVTNCTFSGNLATDHGGGMYNNSGYPMVANCVLWGNMPDQINGVGTVRYSDVQGTWPGAGNIDLDPLFVDSGFWNGNGTPDIPDDDFWVDGDYHLSAGSPCIDAADNTAVPEGIVTDLDGNPRFVDDPNTDDTGFGDPPIVDMGAYEFRDPCADDDGDGRVMICHIPPGNPDNARTITVRVNAVPAHLAHGDSCGPCEEDDGLLLRAGESKVCSADVNGDGGVGPFDLAIVLGAWGSCEGCPTDFNGDNVVNASDLAQVLGAWGMCP